MSSEHIQRLIHLAQTDRAAARVLYRESVRSNDHKTALRAAQWAGDGPLARREARILVNQGEPCEWHRYKKVLPLFIPNQRPKQRPSPDGTDHVMHIPQKKPKSKRRYAFGPRRVTFDAGAIVVPCRWSPLVASSIARECVEFALSGIRAVGHDVTVAQQVIRMIVKYEKAGIDIDDPARGPDLKKSKKNDRLSFVIDSGIRNLRNLGGMAFPTIMDTSVPVPEDLIGGAGFNGYPMSEEVSSDICRAISLYFSLVEHVVDIAERGARWSRIVSTEDLNCAYTNAHKDFSGVVNLSRQIGSFAGAWINRDIDPMLIDEGISKNIRKIIVDNYLRE